MEHETTLVDRAKAGEAAALDALVRQVTPMVHKLAMRMLADPVQAEDAAQEILIRVVTRLSTFEGAARFETWVYRVAVNYLLTARKVLARDPGLSFDAFGADLLHGLADDAAAAPEDHVLLVELRVACTMAMLLCLDPPHRAAYVLGDVLDMSQGEAVEVLEIPAATYRKRLSRARAEVVAFSKAKCGHVSADAECRCPRRLPAAMAAGRVPPEGTFADAPRQMASIKEAKEMVGALQRATGALAPRADLARRILEIVNPPG